MHVLTYVLAQGNRTPLLSVIFELVNIIIVLSYRLQGVHAGSSPCVGLGRPTPRRSKVNMVPRRGCAFVHHGGQTTRTRSLLARK